MVPPLTADNAVDGKIGSAVSMATGCMEHLDMFDERYRNMIIDKKIADECVKKREHILNLLSEAKLKIGNIDEFRQQTLEKISYYEYCHQSVPMHRGFYCPSLIRDICTGKIKRGKVSKNYKDNYSDKFGFDVHGRLLYITRGRELSFKEEFLLYHDNTRVGICFDDFAARYISECKYENDLITSYIFACLLNDDLLGSYEEEFYTYDKDGLKQAIWNNCLASGRIDSMQQFTYTFEHDEQGYLTSYYQEEKSYTPPPKVVWSHLKLPEGPLHFEIDIKRKV